MRILLLSALLASGAAAAPNCAGDADCGKGFSCVAQKTACAVHPESSTCVERVCRRTPAKDEDRACRKDADCAVAVRECVCMYCARPEDLQLGVVAAVNRRKAKAYEAKCTREQTAACATAGACAMSGTMEPRCREKLCVAEFRPRR